MAKIKISKKELAAALKALGLPLDNPIYSAEKLRNGNIEIRIPGSDVPLIYKRRRGGSTPPNN